MTTHAAQRARIDRAEAALLLGVSLRQVDRLVADDRIESVKNGDRTRRIYLDSVEREIERRRTPVASGAAA